MMEHAVRKALSITLVALVASVAAAAAQGAEPTMGERIIAQERAKQVVQRPAPPTMIERLVAQERGRQRDAALFGPSNAGPVVIAAPDAFDLGDAGIGGAATLAAALLAAAAVALRSGSRRRPTGAASA